MEFEEEVGMGISSASRVKMPRYRECLKNHAVSMGGHALDGCGEFMAAGAQGTLDGLKCAACNCHRNFHRKEAHSSYLLAAAYYRAPEGYIQQSQRVGTRDDIQEEDGSGSGSKKRFRTKFTQEQKDKMLGLAERLGWRIQKEDEAVVHHFCNQIGVQRQVLKVWMHNNKHTLGKKP